LIRVSFGPFQLGDLPIGAVEVVKARVLREQLGKRLADEAGVDFDSELPEPAAIKLARGAANPALRAAGPGKEPAKQRKAMADRTERFRFTDRPDRGPREIKEEDRPPRKDRPGGRFPARPPRPRREETVDDAPPRTVFNPDGTESTFVAKTYGKKTKPGGKPTGDKPPFKKEFGDDRPKRSFGDKPRGDFGDRPKRPYTGRPAAGGAERPKRAYGDKPKFGDKPRGDFKGPRKEFGDRPKRPSTGRPAADGAERPKRAYDGKPKRDFGDRPRPSGPGDRPKRPRGSGPGGDRPRRPRPPKA
jgi:23S rRNA pseudouridine2605 synthase